MRTPRSVRIAGGSRIASEFATALRFAFVGVGATLVHLGVVLTLIHFATLPLLVSNLLAFLTAFGVSFAGHHHWTFRRAADPKRSLIRFFVVSVGALLLNSALLFALVRCTPLPPSVAAFVAAGLVPLASLLGSRLWAFRSDD